jgi:hypothetical protein
MTAVQRAHFPSVAASRWGRPWLQMLADLQMAPNTITARACVNPLPKYEDDLVNCTSAYATPACAAARRDQCGPQPDRPA